MAGAIADRFDGALAHYGDGDAPCTADVEWFASGSSSGTILKSDNGIAAGPALPLSGGDVATAGIATGVEIEEDIEVGDDNGVTAGVAAIGNEELDVDLGAGVAITLEFAISAGGSVGFDAGDSVNVGAGRSIGAAVGIGVKLCGGDARDITGGSAEPSGVVVAGVGDAGMGNDSTAAVGVADVAAAG